MGDLINPTVMLFSKYCHIDISMYQVVQYKRYRREWVTFLGMHFFSRDNLANIFLTHHATHNLTQYCSVAKSSVKISNNLQAQKLRNIMQISYQRTNNSSLFL